MQHNGQANGRLCIEMHLPEFQRGYHSGCAGGDPCTGPLTDEDVIDALKAFVEDGLFLPENEVLLQWHIGRLLGEISYESQKRAPGIVAYVLVDGHYEVRRALNQLQGTIVTAIGAQSGTAH
jgi:hypothetical protein